jgi:hypothetical protein
VIPVHAEEIANFGLIILIKLPRPGAMEIGDDWNGNFVTGDQGSKSPDFRERRPGFSLSGDEKPRQ